MKLFSSTSSLQSLSDQQIIERYRNSHDPKYITLLFERYSALIYCIGLHYLKEEKLSKKLVLQIHEQLKEQLRGKNISNLKKWLYNTTRSVCQEILSNYENTAPTEEGPPPLNSEESEDSVAFLQWREVDLKEQQLQPIEKAIDQLPEEQADCFRRFYRENQSFREITEVTAYNTQQIKTLLQQAKKKVIEFLKEAPDGKS